MNKTKVACFGLGYEQKEFVEKLSKYFDIVGFDNDQKAPAIKFVKKFYNIPFRKKDKIKNVLKKEKIKKIYSFATEAPQLLIGYLNSKLNLDGIKYHKIKKVSDKLKFRILLKKNKINQQAFFSYKEIKKLNILKKKIISKPITGSASENIFFLDDIKKLKKKHKSYIFEEFLKTKYVYSIDGFYLKNKFIPIALSKKIKGKSNIFVDKKIMFNIQNKKLEKEASDITRKICSLIKASYTPVHHEFIIKNKKIFPIDFHLRGPGSRVYTYLMNKLIHFKIFETQINLRNTNKISKRKFFSYIYFVNDHVERKNIMNKVKKYSKLKNIYINFKNKKRYKENSARDRIGAFFFEFNKYDDFKKLSEQFNKIL